MSRSRDQCLDLIAKLHSEINKNQLSWDDCEKLILQVEELTKRFYVCRNKKLISESREILISYDKYKAKN